MTQDVEMSGVTLPKGAKVYIHLAPPNHDPAMFVNPTSFDIRQGQRSKTRFFRRVPPCLCSAASSTLEIAKALDIILDRTTRAAPCG